MFQISIDNDFDQWRGEARKLLAAGIEPSSVLWSSTASQCLFEAGELLAKAETTRKVPAEFVKLARTTACFDDPERWGLLYRVLFRLVFETKDLLKIESDPDVRRMKNMEKAVRRDIHKFHAFIRFRRVEVDGDELFVAWHEPHHHTVEMSAPFFERRFGSMRFSILTPRGCAHWDRKTLTFSAPATRDMAPSADETEDFWLLYYRSIFNPFRLKINAMKKELPVRHWRTLPEAALISELIRGAVSSDPEATIRAGNGNNS